MTKEEEHEKRGGVWNPPGRKKSANPLWQKKIPKTMQVLDLNIRQ